MSRTVNGEFLFGEVEKEMLRRHLWLVAEFCGLVVMTYAVMSNHFHLVVRVPKKAAISDDELLRRDRLPTGVNSLEKLRYYLNAMARTFRGHRKLAVGRFRSSRTFLI